MKARYGEVQTFILPESYIEAMKKYLVLEKDSSSTQAAKVQALRELTAAAENIDTINKYVHSEEQSQETVNYRYLTDSQKLDLSLYAVNLINQIRRQYGSQEVVVTDEIIALTNQHVNNVIAANWTGGHYYDDGMLGGYDGLGESFASVGSYWSDGSPALLDFGTIDELKARIYDFFIGWLDEKNNMSNDPSVDYTSNWGHATHILGDGTSNYSRINTAFAINWYSTLPGTHDILLNSTNKIGGVRYENPYESYPENLVAAVTELTKAQQAESLAQKAFDEADEAVKLAEENVEIAKKILESAKEIETAPLVKLSATHFLILVRTNQTDLAVSNKSRAD